MKTGYWIPLMQRATLYGGILLGGATGAHLEGQDADRHTIIALNHPENVIYEVDGRTGEVLNRFETEEQPHEAAITRDGRTLFVSVPLEGESGAYVVILDGETFTERARIVSEHFRRRDPVVRGGMGPQSTTLPHGVALSNDETKLYIGVEWAEVPGVVVFDTGREVVTGKIDLLLEGGHYLRAHPTMNKLYYPHRSDNRVVVIDTESDKVTSIIPVEGGPVGVAFAPNGDVWIHSDYDGSVTVIDSETDTVSEVIPTGGEGAGRVAVSPDGRFAASTRAGTQNVIVLDAVQKRVLAEIPVGQGAGYPTFSPDGAWLYVTNSGDEHISVIDTGTLEVISRHRVAQGFFGGGIRRVGGR
jgi:YVTN family beta-propeller protein